MPVGSEVPVISKLPEESMLRCGAHEVDERTRAGEVELGGDGYAAAGRGTYLAYARSERQANGGYGYILGPSPVPPIYLTGSFGLVHPARIYYTRSAVPQK